MHNLIGKPEHALLVRELNARVFEWLEQTQGMHIALRRDIGFPADQRRPSG